MRYLARVVLIAILSAAATVLAGWWTIPIIGLAYAIVDARARARGRMAAAGAALGWAGILAWYAARGYAVATAAMRLGGLMGIPSVAFVVVTLGFAALLAGCAAVVGSGVRTVRRAA